MCAKTAQRSRRRFLLRIIADHYILQNIENGMKRYLFVCSQNKLRSPTAEEIFRQYDHIETRSGGTDQDANSPVSLDDIEWSDMIFVMEQRHKNLIQKRFKNFISRKKIINLDIPDEYEFMDEELIRILNAKMKSFL